MVNVQRTDILAYKIRAMRVGSILSVNEKYEVKLFDILVSIHGSLYVIGVFNEGECIFKSPIMLNVPRRQRKTLRP